MKTKEEIKEKIKRYKNLVKNYDEIIAKKLCVNISSIKEDADLLKRDIKLLEWVLE